MFGYLIHRLLIMIPTLLVISAITFVIIQLPPGDYLSAYVAELQSQGESVSEATVAIDGLTAIVESLAGRLGDAEPTLREGLDQLRMVYVQLKNSGD